MTYRKTNQPTNGTTIQPTMWLRNMTEKIESELLKLTICFARYYQIGLFSLFNGISTLFGLFNAKAILLEE